MGNWKEFVGLSVCVLAGITTATSLHNIVLNLEEKNQFSVGPESAEGLTSESSTVVMMSNIRHPKEHKFSWYIYTEENNS